MRVAINLELLMGLHGMILTPEGLVSRPRGTICDFHMGGASAYLLVEEVVIHHLI